MFTTVFTYELSTLGVTPTEISYLTKELQTHYSSLNRHYHTIAHLDFLIQELEAVKDKIKDWPVMVFAVAWHDVIYDPTSNTNEESSAELAGHRLWESGLSEERIQKCKKMILATKTHELSLDSDSNYFCDADLAILGVEEERYLDYSMQIRREYAMYPDEQYYPGRRRVLEHFLRMPEIFKTAYFRERYEVQARRNLEMELRHLR